MADTVDAGKVFVQMTYNLERDGPLVLQCYEKLQNDTRSIQVKHYPNTDAVILRLTNGQPPHTVLQWKQYICCVCSMVSLTFKVNSLVSCLSCKIMLTQCSCFPQS